jgi:hypothetical protein
VFYSSNRLTAYAALLEVYYHHSMDLHGVHLWVMIDINSRADIVLCMALEYL